MDACSHGYEVLARSLPSCDASDCFVNRARHDETGPAKSPTPNPPSVSFLNAVMFNTQRPRMPWRFRSRSPVQRRQTVCPCEDDCRCTRLCGTCRGRTFRLRHAFTSFMQPRSPEPHGVCRNPCLTSAVTRLLYSINRHSTKVRACPRTTTSTSVNVRAGVSEITIRSLAAVSCRVGSELKACMMSHVLHTSFIQAVYAPPVGLRSFNRVSS